MRRKTPWGVKAPVWALTTLVLATSDVAAQSQPADEARPFRAKPETASNESAAHEREQNRWIPAISLQTGFIVNQRKSRADTDERGLTEGDTNALYGLFGASAELSTPRIGALPGRPRFFFRGDVFGSRDDQEAVAKEGDPGNPLFEIDENLEDGGVDGILGQGTSLRVQSEPLILSGGIGLSFETEVARRRLRIKPSVEWMFQRDEIHLEWSAVESENTNNPLLCLPCRTSRVKMQTTKGYHSLGPGIEVDLDAGRVGDFTVSVFTQFHALRILGDRQVDLRAESGWFTRTLADVNGETVIQSIDPAVGREDSVVRASYRREAWGYTAAAGVRIYWEPR